jgi:hypothetical protein
MGAPGRYLGIDYARVGASDLRDADSIRHAGANPADAKAPPDQMRGRSRNGSQWLAECLPESAFFETSGSAARDPFGDAGGAPLTAAGSSDSRNDARAHCFGRHDNGIVSVGIDVPGSSK